MKVKYEEDSIIFMKEKQKFEKIERIYEDLRNKNTAPSGGKNPLKAPPKGASSSTAKRAKLADKKGSKQNEVHNAAYHEAGSLDSMSRDSHLESANNSVLTKFFNTKQKDTSYVDLNNKNSKDLLRFLGNSHRTSDWDSNRKQKFASVLQKIENPEISIESLKASMTKKKSVGPKQRGKPRRIYIRIHDAFRKYTGVFSQKPKVVNGRRPFAKEPEIEYDIDSEEEFEDRNAENLDDDEEDKDEKDETEEEEEGEENDGFIVSDDHLSEEEGSDKRGKGKMLTFVTLLLQIGWPPRAKKMPSKCLPRSRYISNFAIIKEERSRS